MAEQYTPSKELDQQLQELESNINAWNLMDNAKRQRGEEFIKKLFAENRDNLFLGLCAIVPKCEHIHIRSLIATLIRSKLAARDSEEEETHSPPKFCGLNDNTQVWFFKSYPCTIDMSLMYLFIYLFID